MTRFVVTSDRIGRPQAIEWEDESGERHALPPIVTATLKHEAQARPLVVIEFPGTLDTEVLT